MFDTGEGKGVEEKATGVHKQEDSNLAKVELIIVLLHQKMWAHASHKTHMPPYQLFEPLASLLPFFTHGHPDGKCVESITHVKGP